MRQQAFYANDFNMHEQAEAALVGKERKEDRKRTSCSSNGRWRLRYTSSSVSSSLLSSPAWPLERIGFALAYLLPTDRDRLCRAKLSPLL